MRLLTGDCAKLVGSPRCFQVKKRVSFGHPLFLVVAQTMTENCDVKVLT